MSELVRVEALRKVYTVDDGRGGHEQVVAVDDVSFTLRDGGSLAIVGESGSGKTTVARILAGMEQASAGTAEVAGEARGAGRVSRADRKRRARQVQMVFQDPYGSLNPRQTVRAALDEVLREHDHGDRAATRGADRAAAGAGRPRRAACRLAAAPPVGWTATARRDRAGAGGAAAAADPRRGGLGARCQRPGAGDQPARRPARADRRRLPVHLPRPRRRAPDQRRVRRDAPRPRRRARRGGRRARPSERPVHPAAAGRDPAPGLDAATAPPSGS